MLHYSTVCTMHGDNFDYKSALGFFINNQNQYISESEIVKSLSACIFFTSLFVSFLPSSTFYTSNRTIGPLTFKTHFQAARPPGLVQVERGREPGASESPSKRLLAHKNKTPPKNPPISPYFQSSYFFCCKKVFTSVAPLSLRYKSVKTKEGYKKRCHLFLIAR